MPTSRRTFLKAISIAVAAPLVPITSNEAAGKGGWQRVCADCKGDARFGAVRATYREAQADADAHVKKYSGHSTGVLPVA